MELLILIAYLILGIIFVTYLTLLIRCDRRLRKENTDKQCLQNYLKPEQKQAIEAIIDTQIQNDDLHRLL